MISSSHNPYPFISRSDPLAGALLHNNNTKKNLATKQLIHLTKQTNIKSTHITLQPNLNNTLHDDNHNNLTNLKTKQIHHTTQTTKKVSHTTNTQLYLNTTLFRATPSKSRLRENHAALAGDSPDDRGIPPRRSSRHPPAHTLPHLNKFRVTTQLHTLTFKSLNNATATNIIVKTFRNSQYPTPPPNSSHQSQSSHCYKISSTTSPSPSTH